MTFSIANALDYRKHMYATDNEVCKYIITNHADVLNILIAMTYRALAIVYERVNETPIPDEEFVRLMDNNITIVVNSIYWSMKEHNITKDHFSKILRKLHTSVLESWIVLEDVQFDSKSFVWKE